MKTNETATKALKNARVLAGFTQPELAQLISVDVRTLQGYEQRDHAPPDILEKMAEVCHAPHLTAQTIGDAVILLVDAASEIEAMQKKAVRIARNGRIDGDEAEDWAALQEEARYLESACAAILSV